MAVVFASTRSVQIATYVDEKTGQLATLCLHTLRADCNKIEKKYH